MSTSTIACNRRDTYYPEEEGLLQQLKQMLLFPIIAREQSMACKINGNTGEIPLRELKLAHPQADWSDIACLFNRTVPVHRNRSAETLRLK
ncbi:hypothetical protein ACJ73_05078 [Blastomyces percursus]|uniref:Uncharacterized protein n=1 Tax=Blastomyces percursus TaxID=1658174 RepID=A0A1J9Q656_9EURO|nr:hypothetical protein ACJ73_05078 [Blastomyces percursus]